MKRIALILTVVLCASVSYPQSTAEKLLLPMGKKKAVAVVDTSYINVKSSPYLALGDG